MTGHPARRADLPTPAGLRGGPIYLGHNATTPVDPRVIERRLGVAGNRAALTGGHVPISRFGLPSVAGLATRVVCTRSPRMYACGTRTPR